MSKGTFGLFDILIGCPVKSRFKTLLFIVALTSISIILVSIFTQSTNPIQNAVGVFSNKYILGITHAANDVKTLTLRPKTDTFINAWEPNSTSFSSGTQYNSYSKIFVRTQNVKHSLIEFDISDLEEGVEVESAKLYLYPTDRSNESDITLHVHPLKKDWSNRSTWNKYDGSKAWTTPGGTESSDIGEEVGRTNVTKLEKFVDIDVTEAVIEWVENNTKNYGFLIVPTSNNNVQYGFASADHWDSSLRPYIVIEYKSENSEHHVSSDTKEKLVDSKKWWETVEGAELKGDLQGNDHDLPPKATVDLANYYSSLNSEISAQGVDYSTLPISDKTKIQPIVLLNRDFYEAYDGIDYEAHYKSAVAKAFKNVEGWYPDQISGYDFDVLDVQIRQIDESIRECVADTGDVGSCRASLSYFYNMKAESESNSSEYLTAFFLPLGKSSGRAFSSKGGLIISGWYVPGFDHTKGVISNYTISEDSKYTNEWKYRNNVISHEIGHNLGLEHSYPNSVMSNPYRTDVTLLDEQNAGEKYVACNSPLNVGIKSCNSYIIGVEKNEVLATWQGPVACQKGTYPDNENVNLQAELYQYYNIGKATLGNPDKVHNVQINNAYINQDIIVDLAGSRYQLVFPGESVNIQSYPILRFIQDPSSDRLLMCDAHGMNCVKMDEGPFKVLQDWYCPMEIKTGGVVSCEGINISNLDSQIYSKIFYEKCDDYHCSALWPVSYQYYGENRYMTGIDQYSDEYRYNLKFELFHNELGNLASYSYPNITIDKYCADTQKCNAFCYSDGHCIDTGDVDHNFSSEACTYEEEPLVTTGVWGKVGCDTGSPTDIGYIDVYQNEILLYSAPIEPDGIYNLDYNFQLGQYYAIRPRKLSELENVCISSKTLEQADFEDRDNDGKIDTVCSDDGYGFRGCESWEGALDVGNDGIEFGYHNCDSACIPADPNDTDAWCRTNDDSWENKKFNYFNMNPEAIFDVSVKTGTNNKEYLEVCFDSRGTNIDIGDGYLIYIDRPIEFVNGSGDLRNAGNPDFITGDSSSEYKKKQDKVCTRIDDEQDGKYSITLEDVQKIDRERGGDDGVITVAAFPDVRKSANYQKTSCRMPRPSSEDDNDFRGSKNVNIGQGASGKESNVTNVQISSVYQTLKQTHPSSFVNITWDYSGSENPKEYYIHRLYGFESDGSASSKHIATLKPGDEGYALKSYRDTNLLPNEEYSYAVEAAVPGTSSNVVWSDKKIIVYQPQGFAGTMYDEEDDQCRITGWARDQDTPTKPIKIDVYIDGTWSEGNFIMGDSANKYRNDLDNLLGGSKYAYHGFDIKLDESNPERRNLVLDGECHPVYAYAINAENTQGWANQIVRNLDETKSIGCNEYKTWDDVESAHPEWENATAVIRCDAPKGEKTPIITPIANATLTVVKTTEEVFTNISHTLFGSPYEDK